MAKLLRIVVLVTVLALTFAACGDEPEDTTAETPGDDPVETPAEDPGEEGADAMVSVASTDLGEVLVDGEGMTLYLFEPDDQGEPTCTDDCATNWPPLVINGDPQAGEGADPALLGTTERIDGTTQVTYDGWPLYRWAQDEAPGDTTGQGVNDVWWAVAADGTPLRDGASNTEREGGSPY